MTEGDLSEDVIYQGDHDGPAGSSTVAVLSEYGSALGVLRHIVDGSPTGLNWGYQGSGPRDLALSLLVDVLGDAARCALCEGTGRRATGERCRCGTGYRVPLAAQLEADIIANLPARWQLRRSDLRRWVEENS